MTTDNPWAWRDGRNPYRSTPFQVLDLPPDVTDPAEIRARIRRRRLRIERAAGRYPLFGQTLSVADVNRAEEQISDVPGRLQAELLTHHPERAAVELEDLLDQYDQISVPPDPAGEVTVNDAVLGRLLPDLSDAAPVPLWGEGKWREGTR